ncbi:RNA-guided endonuclease IscB [Chromatium okenii]|uniref:RNA-guided endonuclease IscB n=1 Tax=Chromatium okenii TaxID=61644 RepID=UPI0026ED67A9|nr:RNA-guided endonuclease IscB [Chromatium okenii]MBV5311008.1 RRXRR domain-containing protein [Chromatium okenii]
MKSNHVLVLDMKRRPLSSCHPARARELLKDGKAAVFRQYPFTIILQRAVSDANPKPCQIKLDPGSKTTGIALIQGEKVIWGGEIAHRGAAIRKKLADRAARRRNRRHRLRYRKPSYRTKAQINNAKRTYMQKRKKGWLPPSLQHRVETTLTWVQRLMRCTPVGAISMELVRFDTQIIQNPEISGLEYQQGELCGFEVKEYLLEKWSRKCAYCGAESVPLQIEHIEPKSQGGSNRISNLTLACVKCNQKKGNRPVTKFLAKKPDLLKKILAQAKAPLKDAAAVNATRWALYYALEETGLPVEVASGGRTKFNRQQFGWNKTHWLDAAAVGSVGNLRLATERPLSVICTGQGGRQKGVFDKYGQPKRNKQGAAQIRPLRPIHGWKTGDLVRFDDQLYRVTPRQIGSFELSVAGQKPFSRPRHRLQRVQCADGYSYV